jgi:hypothetical protein
MSLYATLFCLDGDEWDDDAGRLGAPYAYWASHELPTKNDPRRGWLEIAGIPAHCGTDGGLVDFLRLSTSAADDGDPAVDLLLDREQVTALRDRLTLWLDRTPEEG